MAASAPKLTPEIVADADAVLLRVDRLLAKDATHQAHVRKILTAQRALRRVLANREWDAYLAVEVAWSARLTDALLAVVRWAFAQGRHHPLPTRP